MKNKILLIFLVFFFSNSHAENLLITAKNITLDKDQNVSIFKNDVVVKTKGKTLKGEFAKYDRNSGFLILKNNITILDEKNNLMNADYVEYYDKVIKSEKKSILKDEDGNLINLENFEYSINNSLFKSIGFVEIEDIRKNKYEFTQIFIDTKKKEILGTDSKAYFNDDEFKINPKNNPRVFSNTINLTKENSSFDKSVFTLCQFRENDDCPPWTIQSKKMLHDNLKKTIYYNNAIIKVYDFPIR